jgi:CBS domain-containing protein
MFGEWAPHEQVERLYESARRRVVREIIRRDVVTVTEVDTLETVLEKTLKGGLHRLPVVRDRKPVGMVTRRDLLRLVFRHFPQTTEK